MVPTILITAYPNDRDHALARRSGVTSYLAKPFDDDVLLASVCLALSTPKLN
jgi:DNA-binding response OmpR family regulator